MKYDKFHIGKKLLMKKRLFIAIFLWLMTISLMLSIVALGKGQKVLKPELGNPEVHQLNENILAVTGLYHTAIDKGFTTNAGIIFTSGSVIFINSGQTLA